MVAVKGIRESYMLYTAIAPGTNMFDTGSVLKQRKANVMSALDDVMALFLNDNHCQPTHIILNGAEKELLRNYLRDLYDAEQSKSVSIENRVVTAKPEYSGDFTYKGIKVTSGCSMASGKVTLMTWEGHVELAETKEEDEND